MVEYIPQVALSVTVLGVALGTTVHVVLRKADVRSAVGWIALVWLSPLLGVVLYTLFGVNRIRRKAVVLTRNRPAFNEPDLSAVVPPDKVGELMGGGCDHLVSLAHIGEANVGRPLLGGNSVEPLFGGEVAYPAMLAAIGEAKHSISLGSYIFDNDRTGREFVDALVEAKGRGVEVRVLVDAAGARYSFPTIVTQLRRQGVRAAKFLPSSLIPPYILSLNLRNHRKIMVVDGRLGFTGGMNIRDLSRLDRDSKFPTRDLHFRIEGPVVHQLQEVFAEDWAFSAHENLEGDTWFAAGEASGDVVARGIPDGPDDDLDKLRWTILGAIGAARSSVQIVTPYFLPDAALTDALIIAAMRGIRVEVVMPAKNNLPYVAWASMGQLRPLLSHGVRIWFVGGDFDHSKVCVVDHAWVLLGSPNWDPRSLRLNFEFALECFDRDLAEELSEWTAERIAGAQELTLAAHDARSLPTRLRDGVFRLFSPYL